MREITFDIETKNLFSDVGKNDPTLLDISVVAVHDSETGEYQSFLDTELPSLWPLLERADALIGYNSNHFDIPLLNKYYPGDLTRIKSIDLFQAVYASLGRRLRLDTLAEATLGAQKSADGLQAYRWWKEGNIEAIRTYCIQDVRLTRELYEYARDNKTLKYTDNGSVQSITIDTSDWEGGSDHTLTHTLNF